MGTFRQERVRHLRRTGSIWVIFVTACVLLVVHAPEHVRATVSFSSTDPTGRIAAGDKHTCAIAVNDTIWCWGDNTYSQLGSASFPDGLSLDPIQTTALPGSRIPRQIVAGAHHTCVLATDGTVWCWGQNGNGNLGDGTFLNQVDPVQAVLGRTATVIAAGGSTTCAVLSDNYLKCWGKGNSGQIGNGAMSLSNGTPVYVSSVPSSLTVAHLEIGATHSCAISVIGSAWCWGQYTNGRLGTTALSNAVTPTATAALGGTASEVAAGGAHTCALLTNGKLSCFGNNTTGQLGQALSTTSNSTPTVVTLAASATHVVAGGQFTCALLLTAAVHCFGQNTNGELGSGLSGSARETPAVVTGLTGTVVDVTTGTSHACAVMSTGEVRCWGLNDFGQLGIGTQLNVATATAIATLNVVPTTTTTSTTTTTTTLAPTTTSTTTTTLAPTTTSTTTTTLAPTTTSTTSVPPTTTTTAITTTVAESVAGSETATTSTQPYVKTVSLIHHIVVREGSHVSAAKLAASVSLSIPKRSTGTMRISITKGKKYCAFFGMTLKATQKGTCTFVVILLPKKGQSVVRSNTLTVRSI